MDPRIDRHLHTGTYPETHRDSSATPGSGHALGGRLDPTPRPQLEQLNRALVVLSACNKAVATASSEDELLQHACEAIVRVGGYRLSWVGYAEHDADKRVRPVAQFGFDQGYVESVRITWGEDDRGRGPAGTAIRTGRPQIAQRIATDPRFEPWRADALERGYGSSIALPLVVEGVPSGALLIYAAEPDAFDDAEALMLMQAADDLALGIARQRADSGRRQAEAEQEKTAAALRVQTALLDQLFESAPEAIVLLDMEDRITRANREFMRMFGYSAAECVGRLLNDLIVPPGRMEDALRLTHEVVECGRQCNAESVRRRKDGSTMHVSILGAPICSGEQQIAAYAIYRDISERRRMEQMQARPRALCSPAGRHSERLLARGARQPGRAAACHGGIGATPRRRARTHLDPRRRRTGAAVVRGRRHGYRARRHRNSPRRSGQHADRSGGAGAGCVRHQRRARRRLGWRPAVGRQRGHGHVRCVSPAG